MKINKLKQRLQKDRPMTMVSIRIPEDVMDDLKQVASMHGFSGNQALMKASEKMGIKDEIISSAIAEARSSYQTTRDINQQDI